MAHFTSKATGNFGASGQTTWNETGVPSSGDTWALTNAAHVVTVNDTRSTLGCTSLVGKILTVNGGTLNVTGDILVGMDGHVHCTGNGTLNVSGKIYGDAGGVVDRRAITLAGTNAANRATITANEIDFSQFTIFDSGSGLDLQLSWAYIDSGTFNCTYCKQYSITDTVFSDAQSTFVLSWIKFNAILQRAQLLSTCNMTLSCTYDVGATHLWEDVYFGGRVFNEMTKVEATRVVFNNDIECSGDGACTAWNEGNFIRSVRTTGSPWELPGGVNDYGRTFVFADAPTNDNCPWFNISPVGQQSLMTLTRWIIQGNLSGDSGDCFHVTNNTNKVKLFRCISLFDFDGYAPGTFMQASIALNTDVCAVEHCTIAVSANGQALIAGESTDTVAGAVDSFQSNLIYRKVAGAGSGVARFVTGVNSDIVVKERCGNNGFINITDPPPFTNELVRSPKYVGYDDGTPLFSGSISGDTTDVEKTGNPFVDWDRDIRSYAVARGLASGGDSDATKAAAVMTALKALSNVADPDYDSSVSVEDLLDWIEAGFVPTDSDFQAAHDSEVDGWMGAMEGAASPSGISPAIFHHHNC